jgi:hypothetical protein
MEECPRETPTLESIGSAQGYQSCCNHVILLLTLYLPNSNQCFLLRVNFCIFFDLKNMISTHTKDFSMEKKKKKKTPKFR